MNNIISLLGVEYQIAKMYKDLYNVEKNVNMDNINDLYLLSVVLKEELKNLIGNEEKILISLSNDDINNINMLLENGTIVNLDENDHFTKLVNERISFRINGNNPKLDNDKSSVILNYIIDDFDNYYLSFMEEWIRKETDHTIKEKLFLKKYQYLFLISRQLEKDKIKDSFATEDSVYFSSYFMSQFLKIKDEEYNEIIKQYAISRIISSLNGIIKITNDYNGIEKDKSNYNLVFKLHTYSLRAALILLDDDTRRIVVDKISDKAPFLVDNINNLFDEDFDNLIKEDKERHKKLSLNI